MALLYFLALGLILIIFSIAIRIGEQEGRLHAGMPGMART